MSVNSLIANPQPIKIADPLQQYSNFLKARYMQQEAEKDAMAIQNQNALIKGFAAPGVVDQNGNVNYGAFNQYEAQNQGGANIMPTMIDRSTIFKNTAEAGMNQAKGQNYNSSAIATTLKNQKDLLAGVNINDPKVGLPQFAQHTWQAVNNPVIANMLASQNMTPMDAYKQTMAEAMQHAQSGNWTPYMVGQQTSAENALKQVITPVNYGSGHALFATPENVPGAPSSVVSGSVVNEGMTPAQMAAINPAIANQKATAAAAAQTSTKNIDALRTAAMQVPQNVQHIDMALNELKNPALITGAGGTFKANFIRVLQSMGLAPQGDPSVVATQFTAKILNKNMLDQMQARIGNGTAGRMTNMLYNQIQNSNASIMQDPATIRKILLAQRADEQRKIEMYNGQLSQMGPQNATTLANSGYKPMSYQPEYGIPSQAIDYLKAHPNLAAAFDEKYDQPGAAERILGGTPNGGNPFPQASNSGAP